MHKPWFLKRWAAQGALIVLPIALTFAILLWTIEKTNYVLSIIGSCWPLSLVPIHFPGLGFLVVIVSLIIIGALTESVVVKHCLKLFNYVMSKVPFVKNIYPTIFKFAEMFLGSSSDFKKTVLVEYPKPGIFMLGFVTGTTSHRSISNSIGKDLISVFVPNSPLPTTGAHLLLPKDQIREISMPTEEAFKLIVSAGVVGESNN